MQTPDIKSKSEGFFLAIPPPLEPLNLASNSDAKKLQNWRRIPTLTSVGDTAGRCPKEEERWLHAGTRAAVGVAKSYLVQATCAVA